MDIGQAEDASGEETVHEMEKAGEHQLVCLVQVILEGPVVVVDALGVRGQSPGGSENQDPEE